MRFVDVNAGDIFLKSCIAQYRGESRCMTFRAFESLFNGDNEMSRASNSPSFTIKNMFLVCLKLQEFFFQSKTYLIPLVLIWGILINNNGRYSVARVKVILLSNLKAL
jgi:hypothetical protein